MVAHTKQDYRPAVKRGITCSEKSRIEACAAASGIMLKLTCNEACSKPPNSSRLRSIAPMISSGEPIQAAPLAIWSAAVDWRSLARRRTDR
jgi:hypothetical protein